MTSAADDFVSKRDGWLVAVIWASVAVGGAALVAGVGVDATGERRLARSAVGDRASEGFGKEECLPGSWL